MKKYIVHFIIWGLGIISYYILDKTTAGDESQNISLLLKSFWTKNIWSRQFLLIFIAFNVLARSIGSVLGYKWDDILLVNVENVSNVTKLILIIFYIVIFKNTELPNSFFIRFASKNEALCFAYNELMDLKCKCPNIS